MPYSINPADNTTIGGADVGENCPPDGVNDALRQLAADIAGTVNVPNGETGITLPIIADRASKIAAYDNLGAATAVELDSIYDGSQALMANSRVVMSNLTGMTDGQSVILSEGARSGVFRWSSDNLAGQVTSDPHQGIYIAPTSDITGASGAWSRIYSGPIDIRWFGAVADCTGPGLGTDNAQAIAAAIAVLGNGGTLRIPQMPLAFRTSQTIVLTSGIRIIGDGWHENPGLVNGVSYSGTQQYPGSTIVFDQNVAGVRFVGPTDHNADDIALQYQSSIYSIIENIQLYGGGGTSTSAHGLESRIALFATNVRIQYFAGCGVKTIAWAGSSQPYGNANLSRYSSVHANNCGLHGFFTIGNNSNVITFIDCNAITNGGVGFFDTSELGNGYIVCHAAGNNQSHPSTNGAAFSSAQRAYLLSTSGSGSGTQTGWAGLSDQLAGSFVSTSAVGPHGFYACYVESGVGAKGEIIVPAQVHGGQLASPGNHTTASTGLRINGNTIYNVDQLFTTSSGTFNFDGPLKINGVQVVTSPYTTPIPNTSGVPNTIAYDAEARTSIDLIKAALEHHGLIL